MSRLQSKRAAVGVPALELVESALDAHGCPVHNGRARCPAHDDPGRALSIGEGDDGRMDLLCDGNCELEAILAPLELTPADLFVAGKRPSPAVLTTGSKFEQAAIGYAEQNLHVLPVRPGDKAPLGRLAPRGFRSATMDVNVIRSWWREQPDANVAIAAARSGLLVIDVDAHRRGDDVLYELERELGALPHSPRSITPREGTHTFLALPPDRVSSGPNALGQGVDVVTNGYVVAPPSERANGFYAWEIALDEIAAPPVPAPWLDRLRAKRRRTAVRPDEPIPQGRRNKTLEQMAYSMRSAGFGEGAIFAALTVVNADRCKPPVPEAEVRAWARFAAKLSTAPAWKLDPIGFANSFDLDAIEHRVLIAVLLRANYSGDVIGGEWLARATRHTPNRVNQALRSLTAQHNIIAKTGGGGHGRATRYRIRDDIDGQTGSPPSSTSIPPESTLSDPEKANPERNSNDGAAGRSVKTVEVSQPSGLKNRAGGDA